MLTLLYPIIHIIWPPDINKERGEFCWLRKFNVNSSVARAGGVEMWLYGQGKYDVLQ